MPDDPLSPPDPAAPRLGRALALGLALAGPAAAQDYAIRIDGVEEVCLRGGADLDYWTAALASEGLAPAAWLLLIAAAWRRQGGHPAG